MIRVSTNLLDGLVVSRTTVSSDSDEIVAKIAGNVVVSSSPGGTLKSWRKRVNVKQIDLAQEMKVSPSVLSDYESGRRSSPGIGFIRRYLEALVKLDLAQSRFLQKLVEPRYRGAILAMGEFAQPVKVKTVLSLLQGRVLTGESYIDRSIYGYTVLDSIKTIYALSGFDFYRIFGATTERVLVFTKVGLGRSPLVAIRVSQLKPRMVVIHGPKEIDPIALELAQRENIILALSQMPREEALAEALGKL